MHFMFDNVDEFFLYGPYTGIWPLVVGRFNLYHFNLIYLTIPQKYFDYISQANYNMDTCTCVATKFL